MQRTALERQAYTAKEVAEMLGISDSNVYKMIRRGLLRAVPIGPKEKRIPRQALEEYLAGGGDGNRKEGSVENDD